MDKLVDNVDKVCLRQPFHKAAPVLAIFAKQPVPGQVKTRLCPPLTETEAARLYQVALAETVQRLWDSSPRLILFYAGEYDWFSKAFPEVQLVPQVSGGLGTRLQKAADQLFAAGAGPVLFIGSDSPDLPEALIRDALAELEHADVVTVPCLDGGYALLGLKQPCPQLFADIPWSTPGVLEATRERVARAGLVYQELSEWDDLDDIDSLRRLIDRSPETGTARYVHGQLAHYLAP